MSSKHKKKPVAYPQNILIEGQEIPCRVTPHAKAKKVWFRLKGDGILRITVPRGLPLKELMDLVKKNTSWIREHYNLAKPLAPVKEAGIKNGATLTYLGQKLTLRLEEGPEGRVTFEKTEGHLHFRAGPSLTPADITAVLTHWYREEARLVLTEKTTQFAALMKLTCKKIFIKDQKTRWGSCSSKGNINYNFRLIMAPERVVDYVVVHELCHLAHPNHSREFWDMVGRCYPEYKEAKKWLKDNGSSLKQF
jgi:predicted metal-dependent hydrolase